MKRLYKELFFYQHFVDMINTYLFQSYVARGLFTSQFYDFHLFISKKHQITFNQYKLIFTKNNYKSINKKI